MNDGATIANQFPETTQVRSALHPSGEQNRYRHILLIINIVGWKELNVNIFTLNVTLNNTKLPTLLEHEELALHDPQHVR